MALRLRYFSNETNLFSIFQTFASFTKLTVSAFIPPQGTLYLQGKKISFLNLFFFHGF